MKPSVVGHLKEVVRTPQEKAPVRTDTPTLGALGRYRLLSVLGRGASGIVYRAIDGELKRTVALKKLTDSEIPDAKARFLREAATAAQLKHPNIVSIYDVGEVDGQSYITMEFIEGTTLQRALPELPREKKVRVVRDVALALQHAHDHGVIHRDVKPGNILLGKDGRPYVVDFGLARDIDPASRMTESGVVVGTPSYMSPEQAVGVPGNVDTRTDVYSLGVVLYEAVTGQVPFKGDGVYDLFSAIITKDPPSVRSLDPSIDPDLDAIIRKAIEKDKSLRYPRAADLARDLDAFSRGDAVSARKGTLRRWMRRRRKRIFLFAAVLASVGLVTTAIFALLDRRSLRPAFPQATIQPDAERAAPLTKEAESLLKEAVDFRNQGKLAEAGRSARTTLALLEAASWHASGNDRARLQDFGRCYDLLGEYAQAIQCYRQSTDDMALDFELKSRLQLWAADSLPGPDGYDVAFLTRQEGFQELLPRLEPKEPQGQLKGGKRRAALYTILKNAAAGRVSEAHAAAKELAAQERSGDTLPASLMALFARKPEELPSEAGPWTDMAGQLALALWHIRNAEFQRAQVKLNSIAGHQIRPPPSVYYLQAHTHVFNSKIDDARAALEACRVSDDQRYLVDYLLGVCLLEKDPEAAGERFRNVLRQREDLVEAHYHLAVALSLQGAKAEAFAALEKAVALAKAADRFPEASVRLMSPAARSLLRFRLSRVVVHTDALLDGLRKDPTFGPKVQGLLRN